MAFSSAQHEIKHDGFRIMARRAGGHVRLFTRNGYDFADRFPKIIEAVANLPVRSCLIDGEAIVVDKDGLSVFELLRYRRHDHAAVLCAFDLVELDGNDHSAAAEGLRIPRPPALLEKPGFIDHQHRVLVRKMLGGVVAHQVAQCIGIPPVTAQNHACEYPYTKNNNAAFVLKSVEKVTVTEFSKDLAGASYTLPAGCPPCQPFSTYRQGLSDKSDNRWNLLNRFGRIAKQLKPDFSAGLCLSVTFINCQVQGLMSKQLIGAS